MQTASELSKRQEIFKKAIKDLAVKQIAPKVEQIDNSSEIPNDILSILRKNRLFGLLVPKDLGGEGAGFLDFCIMVEELSKVCPTLAILCTTQNIAARIILFGGDDKKKEFHLPKIANGETFYGLALDRSKDLRGISVVEATSKDDNFIVAGFKKFMVNGDLADFFLLLAPTDSLGENCLLVEKETDKLFLTKIQDMKGAEARYATQVRFEDCIIPKKSLVGEEYKGNLILQNILPELGCANAARAVGLAQATVDYATGYAGERSQFGRPISSFQAVQVMVSDMITNVEAARSLLYKTATGIDQENKDRFYLGYVAKAFASDAAMKVASTALSICGGYGYMRDYPVERMMRNAKICQMSEIRHEEAQLLISQFYV
jgi:alkylation response protein AidB-like acyl-CoA dehydrogenase